MYLYVLRSTEGLKWTFLNQPVGKLEPLLVAMELPKKAKQCFLYLAVDTANILSMLMRILFTTVEPRLADTPEIRTPTVMRTLHAVPNVSYIY